jgi:Flp pilus assembly protein TadG
MSLQCGVTMKQTGKFKNFILSVSGAAAVIFGVTFPVIVGAVGLSVDVAQLMVVRERLSRAVDAAALAAAAMDSDDEGVITDKVDKFLQANYPPDVIGTRIAMSVDLDTENDLLSVAATARFNPAFARVMGFDEVDISASTTVKREVRGLEVVLVLDNTGSMSTNNNIGALRSASTSFVNIMFDAVSEPEYVRIGLVPYSSSVNVGPYGIGLDEAGDPLPTAGFVLPPEDDIYKDYTHADFYNEWEYGIDEADLVYDPTEMGQWHGCVEAEDYPLDVQDHSGPWYMYRYDHEGSTNSWYRDYWRTLNGQYFTNGDRYNSRYGPNYHCPDQPIVPLSSDQGALVTAIGNMQADGFTLGNYGMVWGWRVISPEMPFDEGSDYDDPEWDKAVIMMTDGDNTMNHAYTAYGKTVDHSIRPTQENQRFLEVCDAMKDQDILIYTITFYSNINNTTKGYYRDCATDETKYFDAPSQEDLTEVFEQIARELSNLHITE